jgi:hypothetical protein
MAVLSEEQRGQAHAEFMHESSEGRRSTGNLTKSDIRAAVNAADDWAEANASSYNSALPAAFRTTATAKQKAELLLYVIRRRYEVT